jgi:hypothetical protein
MQQRCCSLLSPISAEDTELEKKVSLCFLMSKFISEIHIFPIAHTSGGRGGARIYRSTLSLSLILLDDLCDRSIIVLDTYYACAASASSLPISAALATEPEDNFWYSCDKTRETSTPAKC